MTTATSQTMRLPCGCVLVLTLTPTTGDRLDFKIVIDRCPPHALVGELIGMLESVSRSEQLTQVQQDEVDELLVRCRPVL